MEFSLISACSTVPCTRHGCISDRAIVILSSGREHRLRMESAQGEISYLSALLTPPMPSYVLCRIVL